MANQPLTVVVVPASLKLEAPDKLIPQARALRRTLRANITVAKREAALEAVTLGIEAPTEKGVDRAKLDPILNTRVKAHYDRITFLEFLLSVLEDLVAEFKDAYLEEFVEAVDDELRGLEAACRKECEEPIAELKKELKESKAELERQRKEAEAAARADEASTRKAPARQAQAPPTEAHVERPPKKA